MMLFISQAIKRRPVICKSDGGFRFSLFLVPSRQRNHRRSFYFQRKYLAKENFGAPAWTSAKCYCGKKNRQSRAGSIALMILPAQVCVANQRRIWFILHACGASQILVMVIGLSGVQFGCLLYTSPSPRDLSTSRMPSSA